MSVNPSCTRRGEIENQDCTSPTETTLGLNHRDGCSTWEILSRSIDVFENLNEQFLHCFPCSRTAHRANALFHSPPEFSSASTLNWTLFRRPKSLIGCVISRMCANNKHERERHRLKKSEILIEFFKRNQRESSGAFNR